MQPNPAPSPLARAAVGELVDKYGSIKAGDLPERLLSPGPDIDDLLATLSRVEAEARREERERVWKAALLASSLTPEGGDASDIVNTINEAAIEDLESFTGPTEAK